MAAPALVAPPRLTPPPHRPLRLLWGRSDAEELLQQAQAKSSNDVNTMANMAVCLQHLEKPPEVVNRYVAQLKDAAPKHPWSERHAELSESFDRCAAQFGKA
jgi:hypothetical protein